MQKDINFKHKASNILDRVALYISGLSFSLLFVFIILLFKQELDIMVITMLALGIPLVFLTSFNIWRNLQYLVDFNSDSNIVNIRYYNKSVECNFSSYIKKTEVSLKNTSSRSGFDCELRLRIEDKSFIINDTFDWTLLEMKLLFEYIKHSKNEPLTEKERSNLSRMEVEIKKNSPLQNL